MKNTTVTFKTNFHKAKVLHWFVITKIIASDPKSYQWLWE